MLFVLAVSILLSVCLLVSDSYNARQEISNLERNPYGKGSAEEEYVVFADGKKIQPELKVAAREKNYTDEELKRAFDRAANKLEHLMLGKNESLDCIRADMNLVTVIPGEPMDVSWEMDRYDVMNIYGELQPESLDEDGEGILINLKAFIKYREDVTREIVHEMTAKVYPPLQTKEEELLSAVAEAVSEEESKSRTKEIIKLPKKVNGKGITYHQKMDYRGLIVLAMGIVSAILLLLLERQKERENIKKREVQMMQDYPDIIGKLNLLLGAGMTVKSAWRKMVMDYEIKREKKGSRYAYEEMQSTYREMQSGVTETESYERFGRRCGLQAYLKLGALLSQNVRKGTKGLTELLRLEAVHAFEERKALAKRLGEEAGTKLLLPMFLMLGIVLVMIIVPAFLSLQI